MTIAIEPIPQALTANERRVKALLEQGKTIFQIAYKLYMGVEAVRDIIFEIRKKESIMAKRLTDAQKAKIMELHNAGMKQLKISLETGCSQVTVSRVINESKKKKTGVNQEFEQAVADMVEQDEITEENSANAEEKSANANPGTMPHCVWEALDDKISMINLDIDTREQRIAELQEEIAELVAEREQIREWMEAHK